MKKRRFVLYFVFMSCLLFFCGAADAAERVLRMDVEARVESDSSLVVTERIAFVAEHVEIRCGLIRDIPIVVSEKGRRVTAKFEVLDVKQDGRPAHYELHRAGRNMEIHLGDDTMLSKGQHEYVVTYRITDQLIFHDDADELYWNVTGNDWIFPIEHATFRVKLPEGAAVVERDAATGAFGAKGADWRRNDDALGESFETTRTLAPGEGFTVMVAWPKGFVAPPPKTGVDAFVDRFGFDNLFAASALFVFVCYSLLWFSVGRDPKRGTIYPAWDPPDGLGPAYIGYARKLEWDTDLLLADLIDLAVRGYLILEPGEKYLTLSRVSSESGEKSWDDLSPPQRQLMEVLFPTGIYTRRLGGDPAAVGSEAAKFTRKLQKLLPVFYGIKKASRSERGYSVSRRAPLVKLNRGAVFLGLLSFVPMLLLVVHIIDWDEPAMLIAFAFLVIFSTIVVQIGRAHV